MSQLTAAITPNPDARIFIANAPLIEGNGYLEVTSDRATRAGLPTLCVELLRLPYVRRVFIANNFVTIAKAAGVRWDDVLHELQETIEQHISAFEYSAAEDAVQSSDDESSIRQVLDSYVAPAIAVDGGAIRFHSFDRESGVLTVDVLGACHGCPSLINTLKRGIEPMIMDLFPQVRSLVRLRK